MHVYVRGVCAASEHFDVVKNLVDCGPDDRLQASIQLVRSLEKLHMFPGAKPSVNTYDVMSALITSEERFVAVQLERALGHLTPKLDDRATWDELIPRLRGSWVPLASLKEETPVRQKISALYMGRYARGVRALWCLISRAIKRDDLDESGVAGLCHILTNSLKGVLSAASHVAVLTDGQFVDVLGTICKLHARVVKELYEFDPSFASDNVPPDLLQGDVRWVDILAKALGTTAVFSSPEGPQALAADAPTRSHKWARRVLCVWADILHANLGLGAETRLTLDRGREHFFNAAMYNLIAGGCWARSSCVQALTLRYAWRCLEDEVGYQWLGPPECFLPVVVSFLTLQPEEVSAWDDDAPVSVIRSDPYERLSSTSGDKEAEDPALEALSVLRCFLQRWPAAADALRERCVEVLRSWGAAKGGTSASCATSFFAGIFMRWTGSGRPPPTEVREVHLALRLGGELLAPLDALEPCAGALEGAFQAASDCSPMVRAAAMRFFGALLCRTRANLAPAVRQAAPDTTTVEHHVLAMARNYLVDPSLPVRYAALGLYADWFYLWFSAGGAPDVDSDLDQLAWSVVTAAFACGEELKDDAMVTGHIKKMFARTDCHAPLEQKFGGMLDRLLDVFQASEMQTRESGAAAFAAAVAMGRLAAGLDGGDDDFVIELAKERARPLGLLDRLLTKLAEVFLSQELLLFHHTPALDGLELAFVASSSVQRGPNDSPLPSIPLDFLFLRLARLHLGGVSPDWPRSSDESVKGVRLEHPARFARLFGMLLGEGSPPIGQRLLDSCLTFGHLAAAAARRFLGVRPGCSTLGDFGEQLALQAPPQGAEEEMFGAAAALSEWLLVRSGGHRPALAASLLSAVVEVVEGGTAPWMSAPLLRICSGAFSKDAAGVLEFCECPHRVAAAIYKVILHRKGLGTCSMMLSALTPVLPLSGSLEIPGTVRPGHEDVCRAFQSVVERVISIEQSMCSSEPKRKRLRCREHFAAGAEMPFAWMREGLADLATVLSLPQLVPLVPSLLAGLSEGYAQRLRELIDVSIVGA